MKNMKQKAEKFSKSSPFQSNPFDFESAKKTAQDAFENAQRKAKTYDTHKVNEDWKKFTHQAGSAFR